MEYEMLVIKPLPFLLNMSHSAFNNITSVPAAAPAVGLTASEAGPVQPQT